MRLHQDNFCQALGVVSEHKYQNEGGPGLAQAFALLRSASRPSAPHTLKLLDHVAFNALIGNHDASPRPKQMSHHRRPLENAQFQSSGAPTQQKARIGDGSGFAG